MGVGRYIGAGLIGLLAGCIQPTAPVAPRPPMPTPPVTISAQSKALAERYARTQSQLLTRGGLRIDGGGPDTPVTASRLVDAFADIAFRQEYTVSNGFTRTSPGAAPMRRWVGPVRYNMVFGPSTSAAKRAEITAEAAALTRNLAIASRHDVALSSGSGNFPVLYMSADELARPDLIQAAFPRLHPQTLRDITQLPASVHCLVYVFDNGPNGGSPSQIVRGLAVIRAEHPPLMRKACLHEELSQGLGLLNDSDFARPTIFNEDQEFALLTGMDRLMLRMLYDPRLSPGMTWDQARGIVRQIAGELAPGSS
jgi:hypothetical protein